VGLSTYYTPKYNHIENGFTIGGSSPITGIYVHFALVKIHIKKLTKDQQKFIMKFDTGNILPSVATLANNRLLMDLYNTINKSDSTSIVKTIK
jgi:hypothetical protein